MEFGEWEINDSVWDVTAAEGEIEYSPSVRRACELAAAAPVHTTKAVVDNRSGLWNAGYQEGLLLVDAMNGFNMLSRLSIL